MMDNIAKRKLELLDEQIQNCKDCNLYGYGRSKPYWTEQSKYMLILEAPGKEEVENNEVLIGKTGRMWWDLASEYQLLKEDFIILNSVNCRVMNGNKNGKPSESHRECCRKWLKAYIRVFKPEKIVLMGNYALHTITGEWKIGEFYKKNLLMSKENVFDIDTTIIKSYHPSSAIYNKKDREKDLRKTLQFIKE